MSTELTTPIKIEIPGIGTIESADLYLKSEVDAAIAELKRENERLKKQSSCTFSEDCLRVRRLRAENESLKAKLAEKDEEIDKQKWRGDEWAKACNQKDKEIESLKASHYAESVDAGMRERKLQHALWLARAKRAEARKNYWYVRSIHEGDKELWSIDGSAVKYIGCIKRVNFDWLKIWSEVERKCRAKAEEY